MSGARNTGTKCEGTYVCAVLLLLDEPQQAPW